VHGGWRDVGGVAASRKRLDRFARRAVRGRHARHLAEHVAEGPGVGVDVDVVGTDHHVADPHPLAHATRGAGADHERPCLADGGRGLEDGRGRSPSGVDQADAGAHQQHGAALELDVAVHGEADVHGVADSGRAFEKRGLFVGHGDENDGGDLTHLGRTGGAGDIHGCFHHRPPCWGPADGRTE
jgi:ketosteroid isomerase-like protein